MNNVHYVMERLGTEATSEDAERVLALAEQLAAEQSDEQGDIRDWLDNRTYPWTTLYEAALGDVGALALARAEAGLASLS